MTDHIAFPQKAKYRWKACTFQKNKLKEVKPTVSKNNMHLRKFNFGKHIMHAISNSAAEAVTC